jgi:hypothetical protein
MHPPLIFRDDNTSSTRRGRKKADKRDVLKSKADKLKPKLKRNIVAKRGRRKKRS